MNNYTLSEDFLKKMTESFAGYLSPSGLESFLKILEVEIQNHYFTFSSESNLLRIISAMYDKQSFITDSIHYPHYVEILTAAAVNSNYLTDILVRNPEYFYRIVNPSHLNKTFSSKELGSIINSTVSNYKTLNGKINALRSLKRRELLRIGLKDILKISSLKEVTSELSILASELASGLFRICYEEVLAKNNIDKIKNSYCIIALGKLGGEELNYSSDIDLMIFYDKDTRYGKKEYKEIITEAVYLFIEQASSVTGGGYIYRVDFRLRPDGRNAPLCSTINDYLNYYESRGEDWERQMLIKAGFLSGDKDLYDKFISYLQPFIYPSSFRSSPAHQIKKLKLSIENALKDQQNIKLARGGIRDIEFTVQALQLINGFRDKELRKANTLDALESLAENKLLTIKEYRDLTEAYIIYRKIEHYLQLMNDLQTHSIPDEGEMLSKLAAFLHFKNGKEFLNDINEKRRNVSLVFSAVTGLTKEEVKDTDAEINFNNKNKAEKDLNYLREGKGLLGTREFDKQSISAFTNIESDLYKYLRRSLNPDLVLQNFVRIIKSAGFPSLWYKSFADKKFFNAFLTICEYSQRAVDLFAEDPGLQEYFLSGNALKKPESILEFNTRKILFTLSIQLCLKMIDPDKFSSMLNAYLTGKIKKLAEEYLSEENYLAASLGSFGSSEMSFASDIDLILVTDKISRSKDQQKIFIKFLQKLKEEFKPFDTDCRLRPEGKSSQLVWDIESYRNYINERARIWELQAFTKLNYTCGDKKLFNALNAALKKRMLKEDCKIISREIRDMRKKIYPADLSGVSAVYNIKRSRGGLIDIEFLLQYFILCNPELYSKFRGKKIGTMIRLLEKNSEGRTKLLMTEKEINLLDANYKLLRKTDLVNQNMFNVSAHILQSEKQKIKALAIYLGYSSPEDFLSSFQQTFKQNHLIYEKYSGS